MADTSFSDEVMESRFDLQGNGDSLPPISKGAVFRREVQEMLGECLEEVPRAQRIAFYLREVEEMKTEDICKKMDISGTNLRVMLFRALQSSPRVFSSLLKNALSSHRRAESAHLLWF